MPVVELVVVPLQRYHSVSIIAGHGSRSAADHYAIDKKPVFHIRADPDIGGRDIPVEPEKFLEFDHIGGAILPFPAPWAPRQLLIRVALRVHPDPFRRERRYGKRFITETGGKYFRAIDKETLENIYAQIDKLEKSDIDVVSYKRYVELFYPFVFAALICILLELVLRTTVFRKFP